MANKITITLTADPTTTFKDVQNAVRRATDNLTRNNAVLIPGAPVTAQGVTIRTRTLKTPKPRTASPIREWAVANGHPEVAGKRGRISKSVIAEYNAHTEAK